MSGPPTLASLAWAKERAGGGLHCVGAPRAEAPPLESPSGCHVFSYVGHTSQPRGSRWKVWLPVTSLMSLSCGDGLMAASFSCTLPMPAPKPHSCYYIHCRDTQLWPSPPKLWLLADSPHLQLRSSLCVSACNRDCRGQTVCVVRHCKLLGLLLLLLTLE